MPSGPWSGTAAHQIFPSAFSFVFHPHNLVAHFYCICANALQAKFSVTETALRTPRLNSDEDGWTSGDVTGDKVNNGAGLDQKCAEFGGVQRWLFGAEKWLFGHSKVAFGASKQRHISSYRSKILFFLDLSVPSSAPEPAGLACR